MRCEWLVCLQCPANKWQLLSCSLLKDCRKRHQWCSAEKVGSAGGSTRCERSICLQCPANKWQLSSCSLLKDCWKRHQWCSAEKVGCAGGSTRCERPICLQCPANKWQLSSCSWQAICFVAVWLLGKWKQGSQSKLDKYDQGHTKKFRFNRETILTITDEVEVTGHSNWLSALLPVLQVPLHYLGNFIFMKDSNRPMRSSRQSTRG